MGISYVAIKFSNLLKIIAMKSKPMESLEKNRHFYFEVGIVLALFFIFIALEWRSAERKINSGTHKNVEFYDEEPILITKRKLPEKKEASTKKNPDKIVVSEPDFIEIDPPFTDFGDEIDTLTDIFMDDDWDPAELFTLGAVELKPVFPGCEDEVGEDARAKCFERMLIKHIAKNYKFSERALSFGVQGKSYVSFTIETDGSIQNLQVVKSDDPLLDDSALKAVETLNRMPKKIKPAYNKGRPVRVTYVIPVNAQLK